MAFMRNPLYILMQDGYVQITKDDGQRSMAFPQLLFDEIVMMRYYNMTAEEKSEAIRRVLETQFETGADGVRKGHDLPTAMERATAGCRKIAEARHGSDYEKRVDETPPKTVWDRFRELGAKIR